MTDSEIVKALECCNNNDIGSCDRCPLDYKNNNLENCEGKLHEAALALINRQKAEIYELQHKIASCNSEIEKLTEENTKLDGANVLLTVTLRNARAEAIKEFAERLKMCRRDSYYNDILPLGAIDNLVKEMTSQQ